MAENGAIPTDGASLPSPLPAVEAMPPFAELDNHQEEAAVEEELATAPHLAPHPQEGQLRLPEHQSPSSPSTRKKGGTKKGSTRIDVPRSKWYAVCEKYVLNQHSYSSQLDFLRSDASGPDFGPRHAMSFSRNLARYKSGTLVNENVKRERKRKYEAIEDRMIRYLTAQEQLREARGVRDSERTTVEGTANGSKNKKTTPNDDLQYNFDQLKPLAEQWAVSMGMPDFMCTPAWLKVVTTRFKSDDAPASKRAKSTYDDDDDEDSIYTLEQAEVALNKVKSFAQRQGVAPQIFGLCDSLAYQIRAHCSASGNKAKRQRKQSSKKEESAGSV